MSDSITRIGRVRRVSAGDFQVECGEELVCFFSISNRECVINRAIDSEVAQLVAERLIEARFPGDTVFIKYEGE